MEIHVFGIGRLVHPVFALDEPQLEGIPYTDTATRTGGPDIVPFLTRTGQST